MSDWWGSPVLTGPVLTLVPLTLDDAADLLAALAEPSAAAAVLEHMRLPVPTDLDGARAQIQDAVDNPGRIAYGMRIRAGHG